MSRCADLHCGPHSYQECALLPELHRHLPALSERSESKGGRGRTCTCEGETPLDLQSSAFAAQPHAQYLIH